MQALPHPSHNLQHYVCSDYDMMLKMTNQICCFGGGCVRTILPGERTDLGCVCTGTHVESERKEPLPQTETISLTLQSTEHCKYLPLSQIDLKLTLSQPPPRNI